MTVENIAPHSERLAAEAHVDPSNSVDVRLGDATVSVLPVRKWRASALKALREGDLETWASKSLDGDGYATWLDVDPTIEDVESMFAEWSAITGQSPGESVASPR